ncbi:MAG: DUF4350 domain-containing protein [Acidobacteria bacterium]|nr:DUF4350 domain-containing protein [Acidobacteriota bacterium]
MRRYFGITITVIIVIVALIALSAAGSIEFDRPPENELVSNRSSYNSGPTGTRAFYQLLEESGMQVARWRDKFSSLKGEAKDATLVIVGPFPLRQRLSDEESAALQSWIASGGRAVVISRTPIEQFPDAMIHSKDSQNPPGLDAPAEQIVNRKSDELIVQPTELTRNVRGLALSDFASRMKFHLPDPGETKPEEDVPGTESPPAPPPPKLEPTIGSDGEEQRQNSSDSSSTIPAPSVSPTPAGVAGAGAETETATEGDEEYWEAMLYAPVIHLGDKDGAVLADFAYGKGRVIFLSDPFVIANNGIARGANLALALNILRSMGAPERKIFFDEYYHGYRSESNPLVNYFRGTSVPWLMLQGLLLCLLVVYSCSRRFARPMPLPQLDRHSPLEFVGSMANLQQVAQARDLAIENIYPRFKAHLCRRLGISTRATTDEIIESARRRRLPVSENELRQTLSDAELTLAGEKIDDARLVALVSRMRRIISQIKR